MSINYKKVAEKLAEKLWSAFEWLGYEECGRLCGLCNGEEDIDGDNEYPCNKEDFAEKLIQKLGEEADD